MKKKLPLRKVAAALDIDTSTLRKLKEVTESQTGAGCYLEQNLQCIGK